MARFAENRQRVCVIPQELLETQRERCIHMVYCTSRTYAFIKYGTYLGNGMKVLPVVPCFMLMLGVFLMGSLTGTSLVFPGSNLMVPHYLINR